MSIKLTGYNQASPPEDDATNAQIRDDIKQTLQDLPAEMRNAQRFFPVKADKSPIIKEWQNPDNQRYRHDVAGLKGFDVCGHGRGVDYLFMDFDHVLNDDGEFLYKDAEKWFNFLSNFGETFCERSISGHGLHMFAVPTADKFQKIASGQRGQIVFDKAVGAKIELFYKPRGRYCLVTGDLFRCEPTATIPHGEVADDMFQQLLNAIAASNPARESSEQSAQTDDSQAGNELEIMRDILRIVDPNQLDDYFDWRNLLFCSKLYGVTFEEFDAFSARDKRTRANGQPMYDSAVLQGMWNSAETVDQVKDGSVKLGTAIKIAEPFGYRPPRRNPHVTGDKDADEWQKVNGVFDKQLYIEICSARDFLQELTPETLTATVASSSTTARKIALCTVYDFALTAAQKFWLRLEDAIANAVAQVKTAKTTGGEFVALPDDVRALAQLNVKDVRKTVDREVKAVQRAHEKFQDKAKADEAKANRNKRATARKDAHDQKLRELDELSKQPQSNERNSKLVDLLRDVCERKVDSFGNEYGFKNTAANAKLIFMHDPVLDGLIGRDEFQQADVFLKSPPWNDSPLCIGSTFKDSDAAHVRVYLAETYEDFGSVQKIDDMLTVTADKNSFHPVKDWLKNLPAWDGKPRAETLFVDFLRVDDTPFAREVTLNWLTAALARIVYPGCNYQTALVLHGNQGIGKSYILERLGGKWYGVLSDSIDDPHALDTINSLWICELKEFRAARKADVNTLKAFIDTAVDTRRAAYERRPKPYPRHVVFGITVNDDGFLNDLTGNRRFPILECKSTRGEYVEGLTDEYVAQVWAEVKAKFKEKFFVNGKMIQDLKVVGKLLELSREAKRQVEAVAEKFLRDDGLANEIQGCLDKPIPPQVIWLTLTRNERRRFMEDAKIYIGGGKRELERRIKSRTQRKSSIDSDVDELYLLLTPENESTLYIKTGDSDALIIFGTELRNHICAAEIRAEFFAPTDKRNNMTRINELLPTIENWHTGARIQKLDPEYPDQKKVFYRDEPTPDEADKDDAHTEDAPETSHDDFIGEPLDLENPPF